MHSSNPTLLRASVKAHGEAQYLRQREAELAAKVKALIAEYAPDRASARDITIAQGSADDLASDLFYSAINEREAAAEDGSDGFREHIEEC